MFGTFRRHQKWIWILGVIVIIPSFVIFFTPDMEQRFSPGGGGGGGGGGIYTIADKPVTIAGRPVTRQEVADAVNETLLSYFIRSGGREWPSVDDRLRREALYRVFLVNKLEDMDIAVSERAVAQMARDRLGNYPYENFEKDVLRPHNLTTKDFERFARHEAGLQQLVSAASVNAQLLTPSEAEFIFRQENQEVRMDVVPFWTSNYMEKIETPAEELAKFYTNNMGRYRIPDRIQVSYVSFELTNFLEKADQRISEITNAAAQIDDYYFQRGTNAFIGTNGLVLSEQEAKAQIRELMRTETALALAHQAANEFGTELFNQPNQNDAQNLDRIAAAKGFPVLVTEPFSRFEPFEQGGLPEDFRQAAMKLSTNAPVMWSPVRGTNAVYVMAFKDRVPGKIQTLEEVQDKVTLNYKETEAGKLARSAATNYYTILTNAMATGKTFAEVNTEQKVEVVEVPPFSPSTTVLTNLDERIELRRLQAMVSRLQVGEVGPYTPTKDGAIIVYYREKVPIDEAKMAKELPELMSRLRQYRRTEAFNQWFSREAQRAPLTIPEPPEPTPPPGMPPGMPQGMSPGSPSS